MTEKELKRMANKIAKCLALAGSSEPAEAAAAKRQANALMKKYNLNSDDAAASQVSQEKTRCNTKNSPANYLHYLASTIAKAFACGQFCYLGMRLRKSEMHFMGVGIKPQLAAYTYDVLSRQLKKHRREYLSTLKRYKRSNKVRMANIFCEHWVHRISQTVGEFAGTEAEKKAITAYKKCYHSDLERKDIKPIQAQNIRDQIAGYAGSQAAKGVSLHKPVHSKRNTLLTEK